MISYGVEINLLDCSDCTDLLLKEDVSEISNRDGSLCNCSTNTSHAGERCKPSRSLCIDVVPDGSFLVYAGVTLIDVKHPHRLDLVGRVHRFALLPVLTCLALRRLRQARVYNDIGPYLAGFVYHDTIPRLPLLKIFHAQNIAGPPVKEPALAKMYTPDARPSS